MEDLHEVVQRIPQVTHRVLERAKRQAQELALAHQMQASLLPETLPEVPGWQFAVALRPARETGGDFYDFFSLPNGRVGFAIADVADKGMGAALYMALSRTLLRTYAGDYPSQPDRLLSAVNSRIIADTRSGLSVTVFYGVLDPASGKLIYSNAGHIPPCLLSNQEHGAIEVLSQTNLPMGVLEDAVWETHTTQLVPGALLLLFTDGIVDAQNQRQEPFGEERMMQTLRASAGHSASEVQDALLSAIREFVGEEPQDDDLTLMVVHRNPE